MQGARIARLIVYAVFAAGLGVAGAIGLLRASTPAPAAPAPMASIAPRSIGAVEQTPIATTAAGEELRARQRAELEGWRWVDRDAGTAAIPITRAMAIIANGQDRP